MSICSTSLRVLSRSRNPPSKTLFPFLYQTATIQQWKPVVRPAARRSINSRPPNREDDIPFEDETLPPSIDQEPARQTTITGSERAAFEKLYKKFSTEGRTEDENYHDVELDQIADEYYEDDEQPFQPSLDEIFDEALKGAPSRASYLSTLRQKKLEQKRLEQAQSRLKKTPDETVFKQKQLAERLRIDELIQNAPTDQALWQILHREVFEKVRELDLDGTKTSSAAQSPTKPDPPTDDARMLFQNYPHHLITAIRTLRTEFPSSQLPLSILPAIKALGRSSHALGATTEFYKQLIRCAWIQQSSYTYVDTLLTEMDNNAIEFDRDILTLLDSMIKEHVGASQGSMGKEMQLVYGMEMFLEGIKKIREWREVVVERLGNVSQEKRASDTIVRRVQSAGERMWRGVAPEEKRARVRNPTNRNTQTTTAEGTNTVPFPDENQEIVDRPSDGLERREAIKETDNSAKIVL